ncbi:MAG: ATP-binding cassette domain-containing protein [Hespellia sp.]|nr:ATP-binding cassette domain-containing protein [Hespellia sp.]
MANIIIKDLCKTYPNGFVSVKNANLKINDNELVAFHGPSGCGKSTILRMIAGLESITSGEIWMDDLLLSDIPARDRPIAMAFQNYNLYTHLNVYENIALGLRLRNVEHNETDFRVQKTAVFLGISEILNHRVRRITDVDRQRVALARAIICNPGVLLIDEDFSRQNDTLKIQMLSDMRRIHEDLGMTILYVTNNYEEAVKYGTEVILMQDGEIKEIVKQKI